MAEIWNKLDSGLISIYSDYLRVRERGLAAAGSVHPSVSTGSGLNVTLYYEGDDDLSEIEALGFRTLSKKVRGQATGTIHLEAVERLVAHPKVRKLSFPRKGRPDLDQSVPDVHANSVWTRAGSTFSGMTGKDVIIGIIDTGIDIRHPFFLKTSDPKTTRILRIWDPGLVPLATEPREEFPPLGRLDTAAQYGVQYTESHINDVLQEVSGAMEIRHRDCGGHGTHVASIAGGDGRDDYTFIGVAPEASFIIVKYFDHATTPRVGGGDVNSHDLFKDAVTYILRTAEADFPGKPVVINCSFGSSLGPHDGFTPDEDYLTDKFDSALNPGKILVQSAGNAAGSRQHALIHFTGADETEIIFEVVDQRTVRTSSDTCTERPDHHDLYIDMWYPDGGPEIEVKLDIPDDGASFLDGPALGADTNGTFDGREWRMIHSLEEQDLNYTVRGTVRRREFLIELKPNARGEHRPGDYTVKVKATAAVDIHLWCYQPDESIAVKLADDPPVTVDDRFTVGDNAGAQHVITVAAYDSEDRPDRPVVFFSSRGPLADYSGGVSNPVELQKPEIAAPGWHIDAASSRDTRKKSKKRKLSASKSGTSMAAPHVTGIVALMLQKNGSLTVQQILDNFENHPRPADGSTALDAEEAKFGRVDAQTAVDNTPTP